jgi:hypothetical protein
MKKSVILAVLGLAVGAVSSFGQGQITFDSYFANPSSGSVKITFAQGGAPVGAGYSFDVFYSLSPLTQAAGSADLLPGWTASSVSPSSTSLAGPMETGTHAGYFQAAQNFTLNPYTAGSTVYFDIAVYQTGQTYGTSAVRGTSGSFSATLATGLNTPPYAQFGSFTVAAVPEPATLALAGLGGLASLVALRRKQA